jgi:ribosomal protein S16
MLNKLVLKKAGRYKKPFYYIVVVNIRNRIVDKIGTLNLNFNNTLKKKKVQLNLFLFYIWLLRGLKPTKTLLKFLKLNF